LRLKKSSTDPSLKLQLVNGLLYILIKAVVQQEALLVKFRCINSLNFAHQESKSYPNIDICCNYWYSQTGICLLLEIFQFLSLVLC